MGGRRADADDPVVEPDEPRGVGVEALLNSLTEREAMLVRATETEVLRDLDEDALVDLHLRVRRARHAGQDLPQAGRGARPRDRRAGRGAPKNTRNRDKAEVFEDALARVSRGLAAAARASAAALRAERLAEARRATAPPRPTRARAVPQDPGGDPQVIDRRPDDPGLRKRHASERAAVARQQARRDAR